MDHISFSAHIDHTLTEQTADAR